MRHTAAEGAPKILDECVFPLTGSRVVDRIITEMGVFNCDKKGDGGLVLVEIAPGVTVESVQAATKSSFRISDSLRLMSDE